MSENHRECPCGCGELADECTGSRPNPFGSMRTSGSQRRWQR